MSVPRVSPLQLIKAPQERLTQIGARKIVQPDSIVPSIQENN
jgi:hypothetical protein